MRNKIFTILLVITMLCSLYSPAHAAVIVEKSQTREFVVQKDYIDVTEVKETKIVQYGYQINSGSTESFTIFNPVKGDPDEKTKLAATLKSIKITDQFGTALSYKTKKTDSKNYILSATIPFTINYNQKAVITLKYKSYGLVVNVGAVKDVYIPGFPKDYKFSTDVYNETITSTVKIPNSFPEINFVSPKVDVKKDANFRTLTIPTSKLINQTGWIQIGTSQYFSFELSQSIPKSTSMPFVLNSFSMPLPRDINNGPVSQKVYYTEISPKPTYLSLDRDGNLIINYKVPADKETIVNVKGYAILSQNNKYALKDGGSLKDIPENLKQNYIGQAKYWEVDASAIQSAAKGIKGTSTDVYDLVNKTYKYVVSKIDYSFVKKYGINARQGALKTLQAGAGVCMEYSDLFITLMRAEGVPARAAFGFGYGELDYESQKDRNINHQWAEVYIPKQDTWIDVDTTWGDFGPAIIGGDLNHFYSHVASIDPETPSTSQVTFFGSIPEIPDRKMTIDVQASIDDFKTSHDQSQADLLVKYHVAKGFSKFAELIRIEVGIGNGYANNFLTSKLGIESRNMRNAVKILVFCLPLSLLIALFVTRKARRTPQP